MSMKSIFKLNLSFWFLSTYILKLIKYELMKTKKYLYELFFPYFICFVVNVAPHQTTHERHSEAALGQAMLLGLRDALRLGQQVRRPPRLALQEEHEAGEDEEGGDHRQQVRVRNRFGTFVLLSKQFSVWFLVRLFWDCFTDVHSKYLFTWCFT